MTNNHIYVTSIRKKPTGFIRKLEKKLKTSQTWIYLFSELKNDGNVKESSCPHLSVSLGPYSDDIDFVLMT